MNTELQSLNTRIAERVGESLVDLLPENVWQEIIDKEIKKFEEVVLPAIIQDILKETCMTKVKTTIDNLLYESSFDSITQTYINNKLKEFIGDSSGVILAGMLTPSMQAVLSNLRNQLGY